MLTILWQRFILLKKNPKLFIAMLLLPLIFTFAFSGMGNQKIQIPVINDDKSEFSYKLIEEINSTGLYAAIDIERSEATNKISEGLYEVGVVIPENFGNQMVSGNQPVIKLISAKESPFIISFKGVLTGILQNLQYNVNIVNLSLKTFDRMDLAYNQTEAEQRLYQLTEENRRNAQPIKVNQTVAYSKDNYVYDHKLQLLLGFTLYFSIFTIIFSLSEILNDQKNGVWDKLIISPLTKFQIYMGNFLYSFSVGFIQISLLILIGKYLIGVNWGDNLLIVFLIVALYIFAVMALGMVLISFTKTSQQLNAIVPIIAVSSAMLGGAFWPLEIVSSKILLTVANLVPIMHAMTAVKEIVLYHRGWDAVWIPGATLLLIGVFLMGIGMHWIERKSV